MTHLTPEEADVLGTDLVIALSPHIGNGQRIDRALARWLEVLGPIPFAQVCLAALTTTFGECLTMTDPSDWPPHGVALYPPQEATA